MRCVIIRPLSPAATHWTGRSQYHIDTAALLLSGADPASIETKEPENVTVGDAWAAPAFATGSKVWRERLVRAALAGDLAASIDGKSGTVGVWGRNGLWSSMALGEAARLEKVFEVRSSNVFFDIERRELSNWLEKEGFELPFWLAGAGAEISEKLPGWWFVVPLRLALEHGLPPAGTDRQLLRTVRDEMKRMPALCGEKTHPESKPQQLAARAALDLDAEFNQEGSPPPKSYALTGALWRWAAHRAGVKYDEIRELKGALMAKGLHCPSEQQLAQVIALADELGAEQ